MAETIEMTEEQFDAKFTMRQNHIVMDNEDHFETYGPEHDFITDPFNAQHIWTVIDGDDGMCIVSGYHHVNRVYHMISNEAHFGEDIVCQWEGVE
jgi:hypothetical protein